MDFAFAPFVLGLVAAALAHVHAEYCQWRIRSPKACHAEIPLIASAYAANACSALAHSWPFIP
ncbi:MAG TPA: hypothetical protein VKU02_19185 [Gemmataceae bacterium]|nr:hypothetical protein [Gemmataceae bacterium]